VRAGSPYVPSLIGYRLIVVISYKMAAVAGGYLESSVGALLVSACHAFNPMAAVLTFSVRPLAACPRLNHGFCPMICAAPGYN
jgi:hypothetical protein